MPTSRRADGQRHHTRHAQERGCPLYRTNHPVTGILRSFELPPDFRPQCVHRRNGPRPVIGNPQPIAVVNQRAGLDDSGFGERGESHEHPWADHEASRRKPVRLQDQGIRNRERGFANGDRIADEGAGPAQQARLYHDPWSTAACIQSVFETAAAYKPYRAIERIPVIDSLELDGHPLTVDPRGGAELGNPGKSTDLAHLRLQRVLQRHVGHSDRHVCAQEHRAAPLQGAGQAVPHQPYRTDDQGRHGHAGDKNLETQYARGQFGTEQSSQQPRMMCDFTHAAIRPASISTVRSHSAARPGSWVTISIAAPVSRTSLNITSATSPPVD